MNLLTSAALATAFAAALASPVANAATTSTISLTLLPYITSDLDTTDAYSPLAVDFTQAKVGYSFSVGTNTPYFEGYYGSSPLGPAPFYTPLDGGPMSRFESYGPARVSFATDGAQQIDINASLTDLGAAKAAIGIYVPVIVNPHTSISFITRSAIEMNYDAGANGGAYSFTTASLRRFDRVPVFDTVPPFNVSGDGEWANDELDTFTNVTDQAITLQYNFTAYTALVLTAPPEIPPTLPVPEPATYAMFAAGALVLLGARRRKSS